jgi:hypothetical protein
MYTNLSASVRCVVVVVGTLVIVPSIIAQSSRRPPPRPTQPPSSIRVVRVEYSAEVPPALEDKVESALAKAGLRSSPGGTSAAEAVLVVEVTRGSVSRYAPHREGASVANYVDLDTLQCRITFTPRGGAPVHMMDLFGTEQVSVGEDSGLASVTQSAGDNLARAPALGIFGALLTAHTQHSPDPLLAALDHNDDAVQRVAADHVAQIASELHDDRSAALMVGLLDHRGAYVRSKAYEAVPVFGVAALEPLKQ